MSAFFTRTLMRPHASSSVLTIISTAASSVTDAAYAINMLSAPVYHRAKTYLNLSNLSAHAGPNTVTRRFLRLRPAPARYYEHIEGSTVATMSRRYIRVRRHSANSLCNYLNWQCLRLSLVDRLKSLKMRASLTNSVKDSVNSPAGRRSVATSTSTDIHLRVCGIYRRTGRSCRGSQDRTRPCCDRPAGFAAPAIRRRI